jgi:allantoinase
MIEAGSERVDGESRRGSWSRAGRPPFRSGDVHGGDERVVGRDELRPRAHAGFDRKAGGLAASDRGEEQERGEGSHGEQEVRPAHADIIPIVILRSRRVVTPQGTRPASVHIRDGRIERVLEFEDVEGEVIDYGDLLLMPGIVDSHVHVNEPGRTEWEGFETATRAAAAGGVTTIVDMPLNSIPPTTTPESIETKLRAMDGKCRVDVGLWGGAVPGNARLLPEMVREGALGFKCFLVDSGVAEFGHLDRAGLEDALRALRDQDVPLLVHAELAEYIRPLEPTRAYEAYLKSRPRTAEDAAIELVAKMEARAHIVHLSSASALDTIRIPMTAETTPHYLYFDAERIPDGATEFKCAPPIREHSNRERLWQGVRDGVITAIVSDHSPCTPELKRLDEGDFAGAWGGIASLQFGLAIVWTEARKRGMPIEAISRLMSSGPASIAGIADRKGAIASGYDADVIVFDADAQFRVGPDVIEHRHSVCPYNGEQLTGVVKATYLRGTKVWEDGAHVGTPQGTWMRR